MKKLAFIIITSAAFVGCASKPTVGSAPDAVKPVATSAEVAIASNAIRSNTGAPDWFIKLPTSTEDMVFGAGTGSSVDEQMAYDKPRMFAERKLVEEAYAVISTQTKSYRNDSGDNLQARFETFTRKNAQGQIVGVEQVTSQSMFDGKKYKVYVLIQLPLGDNNIRQQAQIKAKNAKEAEYRARAAEKSMEANQAQLRTQDKQRDQELQRRIAPELTLDAGETIVKEVIIQ